MLESRGPRVSEAPMRHGPTVEARMVDPSNPIYHLGGEQPFLVLHEGDILEFDLDKQSLYVIEKPIEASLPTIYALTASKSYGQRIVEAIRV